jgi:hypothetical protein
MKGLKLITAMILALGATPLAAEGQEEPITSGAMSCQCGQSAASCLSVSQCQKPTLIA